MCISGFSEVESELSIKIARNFLTGKHNFLHHCQA